MPYVISDKTKIHYESFGQGEPLLFIMGIAADHMAWKKQIEFFSNKYKVIVFDNRGSGQSDKPAFPYTIPSLVKDTTNLLDHLDIKKADVVGLSMGGMVAQELAINFPERIKKVILVNTYCQPIQTIKEFVKKSFSVEMLKSMAEGKIVEFFLNMVLTKGFAQRYPDVFEGMMENNLKSFSKIGLINQIAATQLHNTKERLKFIKSRTLVLYGENDNLIPSECASILHENIKDSKIVMLKNGSHAMNWEQAEEFNRILADFLKD